MSAAVFLVGMLASSHQALSQSAKKEVLQAPASAAGMMLKVPVEVDGFRGANFGMTQDEVKRAIFSDFKLRGGAIK